MIGFDTETYLIRPGLLAPKLVCATFSDGKTEHLAARDDAKLLFRDLLRDQVPIVVQNAAFDMGVLAAEDPDLLPYIFLAYEKGLIHCTKIRQELIDIAEGHLKRFPDRSLQALVKRYFDRHLEKEDTWRLKYHELDGVPLDQWPEEAKFYAKNDASEHLRVFQAQEKFLDGSVLEDEGLQTRSAFALHLMSCWGIRTDKEAVDKIEAELAEVVNEHKKVLMAEKIIRDDKKQSRDLNMVRQRIEAAFAVLGEEPKRTAKTGKVSTDEETLKAASEADPVLSRLAEYSHDLKLLTTYVPVLKQGVRLPINARYNGLVDTGRTSCSKPNMQNPPRKGGIRECFVPRPGFLFCSVDYDTIELRALAQACLDLLGESRMATLLQQGRDLHLAMAAELMGTTYEEIEKRYNSGEEKASELRQFAKIPNFGLPGGMGAEALISFAKGYGVEITLERAQEVKKTWLKTFPEMQKYFKYVTELLEVPYYSSRPPSVKHLRSGRIRGDVHFCAACNGFFQGLTADGAKDALWEVTKECYAMPDSDLYGSRPVIFLHDEIICEVPEHPVLAHRAAQRLAKVMIDTMQKWIPNIPIGASPSLMRRWYKGAKPVYEHGLLVPWEPKPSA